ncbi:MAG: cell division/cell wall cluster transcriptional repressor MraZ [Candidatus Symbiothrix sp.]|nr:cell division/cell wall cluster transcriptional repressor MraZ [Candidatus Symbiothrix sp.]
MENFVGNSSTKLDAKNRVPLPVIFRRSWQEGDDQRLVLTPDLYQKCLVLYPRAAWEAEKNNMRSRLDLYDEEQMSIYEAYVGRANPVEMDSMGRILIPKEFADEAGLKSDVRFVGIDDKIKVWDEAEYSRFIQSSRENFKANARRFLVKPKTEDKA